MDDSKLERSRELWNEDLAPTDAAHRTWTAYHYLTLWIGMVVCITSYMLGGGLIDQGFSAWQVVGMVLAANTVCLVPMLLNAHAGAKYAVPFAVLVRTSFGTRGAKLPALLRAMVACGWFGIQCWIGGGAIYAIGNIVSGGALIGSKISWLGIDAGQFTSFGVFWALHLYFVARGPESVRSIEVVTAPIKILILLALLGWAYVHAHGFGAMLHAPSQFVPGGPKAGQFWTLFWPSLTALCAMWSTLAMNIPDFTRFARSQRDQIIGQSIGLPLPMAALAFVGVAVTSATVTIYGKAIWDPVDLAGRMEGIAVAIGLGIITLDTLCVNLAANVVGPAYDFAAIFPRHVNFARGGYLTAVVGVLIMPWKLIESSGGYIFTWLGGFRRTTRARARDHDRRLLAGPPHPDQRHRSISVRWLLLLSQWLESGSVYRFHPGGAPQPTRFSSYGLSACIRGHPQAPHGNLQLRLVRGRADRNALVRWFDGLQGIHSLGF
jgi:NCS1 family nucleobase:cation symporter-1